MCSGLQGSLGNDDDGSEKEKKKKKKKKERKKSEYAFFQTLSSLSRPSYFVECDCMQG